MHHGESAPARTPFDRHAWGYGVVLALVFATYTLTMVTNNQGPGSVAIILMQGAALLVTMETAHLPRLWVLLCGFFVLFALSCAVLLEFFDVDLLFTGHISLLNALLFFGAPVIILLDIGRHEEITGNLILGAVNVYLLIGMAFGYIYGALDRGMGYDIPFFAGIPQADTSDYMFFSFTTLTTLGYGNLVPVDAWGRSIAIAEVLLGQIYLVIVVARLVALWKRPVRQ